MSTWIICPLFDLLLLLLLLSCMSYLYILEIKSLSVASFASIFSQSVGCLFVCLWFSLLNKSLSVWLGPLCLFLLLFLLPWEIDLRNHWYDLCQRMFCLCSLLGVYGVMAFIYVFKPFWVYFCVRCDNLFLFHWFVFCCPALPTWLPEKTVFSLLYILASFVED